jgi:toxin secretion/phage lysis holin
MNGKEIFKTIIAVVGSFLSYILGGWDTILSILVYFMAIDYLTGLISAFIQHSLNSQIGFRGILRKSTIMLILIMAVLLDRLLNDSTWVFRTLVCYFYIANEGISILENCGKSGLPLPPKLLKTLEQLKNNGEE